MIAVMVGLDSRATMDMDATIKDVLLSEKNIKDMFDDLCKTELKEDIEARFCFNESTLTSFTGW